MDIKREHIEDALQHITHENITEELLTEAYKYSKLGLAFVYMHTVTGELKTGYIRYGEGVPEYIKKAIVLAHTQTPVIFDEIELTTPEDIEFQLQIVYGG